MNAVPVPHIFIEEIAKKWLFLIISEGSSNESVVNPESSFPDPDPAKTFQKILIQGCGAGAAWSRHF